MPALLRGPAAHPAAPGAVVAERAVDLAVVAGQVVLGEQVELQRGPRDRRQGGLLERPLLAVGADEVLALAPGDVLVRHPVLGGRQVPVEVLRDGRLELDEELGGVECSHGGSSQGRALAGPSPGTQPTRA